MANSSDPHGTEQRRIIKSINDAWRSGSISAFDRRRYIMWTLKGNYRAWPERWYA